MPISWNEIRKRAIEFSHEWKDASREKSETQSFYNDFFNVFGISRRRVASFEEPVKKLGEKRGFIDLFWKGLLLVEQKSKGRNLVLAKEQALDYFPNLREEELPRYILVSDFQNFELYDYETGAEIKFKLKHFHKNIEHFGFIAGYKKRTFEDQDPVNIKASELMGKLHDRLKDSGYAGAELELLLVRLLFCLFADDTGIFEKDIFRQFIEEQTREDGSDLGARLAELFQTLNTSDFHRPKALDEDLSRFPYVNGLLFEERLPISAFDSEMREALLKACYFDWTFISPAIFGSLFQSVMDKDKRRGIGAHYTTEQNILKVIRPLFMDELWGEFEKIKTNSNKLKEFQQKLGRFKFLDPACGCGNFLVIAYRELRLLELEILKRLVHPDQKELDVRHLSVINVDQFYGIEIEEFPARIAEVAMWLMDHQMNKALSEAFGQYYTRIPLITAAKIVHGNALTLDWESVVPKGELSYILGNPPFGGKKEQKPHQKEEMKAVFKDVNGAGVLDYVAAWYLKAAKYIQNTSIRCAFVSTNSITQGEQVGLLWNELYNKYRIKIHFAHRTFAWDSEAKGKAHVHVIIIGFGLDDVKVKKIYEYEHKTANPHEFIVRNINPYIVEGPDTVILKRSSPLCDVPVMNYGSIAIDNGHLILSDKEKDEILSSFPGYEKYIRPYIGSEEFLNNVSRWCLWLTGISSKELKACPPILERVKATRDFRLHSGRQTTKELAEIPTLFGEIRQPKTKYLIIPKVSSEKRKYIPIGYCAPNIIANGSCLVLPGAGLYEFGIISSSMHNEWMRNVGGRTKSDYQYSSSIIYNNFPWPENPSAGHVKAIEEKTQGVIGARDKFPESSLADLYDLLTMPPALLKAHRALDRAVDLAYRPQAFPSEKSRMEFLLDLYQKYTAPLTHEKKGKRRKLSAPSP